MTATSYVQGRAGRIETRLTVPSTPRTGQVAVICHPHPLYGGTMTNKVVTTVAKALLDHGITTVIFNFRGVGDSEGQHDYGRGEVDDALAVTAWAIEQTQAKTLILAGFSFGSFIAAMASQQLPSSIELQQLWLLAPPVHHYQFPNLNAESQKIRVIQGEADEVVPVADVLAWSAAHQLTTIRLPACSHFFHGHLVALRQIISQHTP
ncbi:alpha/beta hydrolase [Agitococcus lubricus]|uniref:AB hydrolase-1 domain-containing protein n=1 Tax=Agitococcus lubricus TaxID=1077255 RepID=A0A2T5J0M1_9GAMM|nr:alpha/beta fold hydrolase [Agitococcus lubricus]PTQ89894.1 hypothetical protein C8N29_105223 [Agitococcus lubricus]